DVNGLTVLAGGDPADPLPLESDDDTIIWNNGDGSDTIEGGIGRDVVEFNGSVQADVIDVSADGERLLLRRLEPTEVTLDIGTSEVLSVFGRVGDDGMNVGPLGTVTG